MERLFYKIQLNPGKKIGIIPAPGLGDSLIFQIATANLQRMGYHVTMFSKHLGGFGSWLPGFTFMPLPTLDQIFSLSSFDGLILQHDNSDFSKAIKKLDLPVFCFYGSHLASKHGEKTERDFVCDPNQTMVKNLVSALTLWLGAASSETGLAPPQGLIYRKYPKRIAIHPSSGAFEKNWDLAKFTRVATRLKQEGWDPVFLARNDSILCPTLEELASLLYESGSYIGNDSGPGHLASALNIPSLIIAQEEQLMRLWKPGWRPAALALPPKWVSNWKWTKRNWKKFISINKIIKLVHSSILRNI